MRIPFVGSSGKAHSVSAKATRTVNLYPEAVPEGKSPSVFYGTPGLSLFAATATGAGRGAYSVAGRMFVVVGATLYEIDSSGTPTSRGTLSTSTGDVDIADNGSQMLIVDGASGYQFTLATNAFALITDPDFPACDKADFVDGYFVLNETGTGRFWLTSLYGTDVDALDFATAEGAPDDIVSIIVDHRELWLIGEKTSEVWYNSGVADFPFARLDGAFVEMGCAAPQSVAKTDNAVFWLSANDHGNGQVIRAQGYQPAIISTREMEDELRGYPTVSDARAYTYQDGGHTFYVLNFPTADKTWVFDAASGLWHERMYWDGVAERRHRGACYAYCFGKHLVLDHSNGNVYHMSLDVYSDNGDEIRAIRRTQHQHAQGKRIFWHELQVVFEAGVGLSSGQGSDPKAMLRWSDDDGRTWSSEHWTSIGAQGEYAHRAMWRRLGQSRNRIYEVVISDPVKRAMVDAWAEAEVSR